MHPLTERLIARSPAGLRTFVALTLRTANGAMRNRLPGLAAEIAFWLVLSLPALILASLATIGLVARDDAAWEEQVIDRVAELASVALTPQAIDTVVRPVLQNLTEASNLSVISFGFAIAVWVASRAVKVVLVTVALTYGAEQPGGLSHRLLGLLVTFLGLMIGVVLAPLVIAGPGLGQQLAEQLGPGEGTLTVVADLYRAVYWPFAASIATAAIAALYHLGAPWNTRWRRDLPGAVLATTVWLAGSAGLRLYGVWILGSDSVYGPLAGPIVALLWVWLTGFAVLLGAQLNAQIEQRWPTRPVGDESPTGLKRFTTTSRLAPVEPPPAGRS